MKQHGSINHIYRLIWSKVLSLWVAVAENRRTGGKGSRGTMSCTGMASITALTFSFGLAQAAPSGAQLVSGAASIIQSGATTTITQASPTLSVNWQGFNVGPQESVNFIQPSKAALAVNRIFDTSATRIFGRLTANGQVYLINPNGILFGPSAQVNVGAMVASTLDLKDANLAGNSKTFSGKGTGSVINQGAINAANAGFVALLGNQVSNAGVITAQLGAVALGAGSAATLTFGAGSLVQMQIDQGVLNSLVGNGGLIEADGGLVLMTAGAHQALMASVVNNTGIVQVSSVNQGGGVIRLEGDYVVQGGTLKASGTQGGAITLAARALLDAGVAQTNGTSGNGGTIDYSARDAIVETSSASLHANAAGSNGGSVRLQGASSLFSSGQIEATGQHGGAIDLLGRNVSLAAARVDASGAASGGVIRVGGDFHGANASITNAQTANMNAASSLVADGGSGKVVLWSDQSTDFYGRISANLGGQIEVSSAGTLTYSGQASAGKGGTLLLDPVNLILSATASPASFALPDPHPAIGNQFGASVVALGSTVNGVFTGNGKVVISSTGDSFGGANAGAVYVFDSTTGALVSSLTGSHANDAVGNSAVFLAIGPASNAPILALSNGNFVVPTGSWNGYIGAATFGSGVSGVSGVVSAANSLVGTVAGDQVGQTVSALANGNYVVSSPAWNGNLGAATFGSGVAGVSGAVSSSNSLVGTTAGDNVGQQVTALSNGNYVAFSSTWSGGKGAATFGNGVSGAVGVVSSINSLVGSSSSDQVSSNGVTALTNGNYVVASSSWNGNLGAATFGNGATGIAGLVTAANSLTGTTASDNVGGQVTALSNGNYVVSSSSWSGNKGAATWGNGVTGLTGTVSASNSLVGSTSADQVGLSVTALTNGNYVVSSPNWSGNKGAATLGNGAGGISGAISASNSLVGTTSGDKVGSAVTALTNGNYVVSSLNWSGNKGAATFGNGVTGVQGAVTSSNSLVGTTNGDLVSWNDNGIETGIIALANGNYVVGSSSWGGNLGAATFGNGVTGIVGAVTGINSLVGSSSGDIVSSYGIGVLSNGGYLVLSPGWSGGKGAASFGSGVTGVSGAVSASNSLVGTTNGDQISGYGGAVLANGNYVVASGQWSGNKGAVTYGNGFTGVSGAVSASNSLLGASTGDQMGNLVLALANGNYLVANGNASGNTGQVLVGLAPDINFNLVPGQSLSFNPSALTATLAAGTAVTLQASNDITLNAAISVGGATGGALTLQAGRNINLNANLTTANGNLTAVAGDPGALAQDVQSGTPAITLGAGASINAGAGVVTLSAMGGNFVNNSGSATPITAASTRIYSSTLAADSFGAMLTSPHFYHCSSAVSCAAGVTLPVSGISFLFPFVPVLTVTANPLSKIAGAPDPVLTYGASGFVQGDTSSSLSGALTRASGETVAGGPYAISQGSLASTLGYALNYVASALTITPQSSATASTGSAASTSTSNVLSTPLELINLRAQLATDSRIEAASSFDALNPSSRVSVIQIASAEALDDNAEVSFKTRGHAKVGPRITIIHGGVALVTK